MSLCVSDIPKDRILKHENGKMYLNLQTWDNDEPDKYGNHFSVSIPLSKEEVARKKAGEDVKRVYLGNGKIWPDAAPKIKAATAEETDDLPF